MTEINWGEMSPQVYEEMVSVLLSTLHPTAERIDGAGGDGGRDVQIRHEDRIDVFELKSFTGRVGKEKGRRRQVEASLETAAKLNPASWTLVVPINHNESELAWFDGLQTKYPFPLIWHGRTWLNQQMAAHPEIRRYFLDNAATEVVQVLRELHQEQAALANGVPDAIERLHTIRKRLDEIDPYYRLDIAVSSDHTAVTLVPRFRNALRDRPITVHALFAFPDTELGIEAAAELQALFDYGDDATIRTEHIDHVRVDAPAGLGGTFTNATISLQPSAGSIALDAHGRLQIVDPSGHQLASVPLRYFERRRGTRGGTLKAQDLTASIQLVLRVDVESRTATTTLTVQPASGLFPSQLLSVLRVGLHAHGPNRARIYIGDLQIGDTPSLPGTTGTHSSAQVKLVDDLRLVQDETGTPFPVPDELTPTEVRDIHDAARLLAGEILDLSVNDMTVPVFPADPDRFAEQVANTEPIVVGYETTEYGTTIAGIPVPLGPARMFLEAARLANRDEVLAARPWDPDQAVQLVFVPEPGAKLKVMLLANPGDTEGDAG